MQDEEWGPWIEHDGKGCPCAGAFVESEDRSGNVQRHIADMAAFRASNDGIWLIKHDLTFLPSAWVWGEVPARFEIIRYRIRKPRALLDLIERARSLDDAPEGPRHVKHKETAK